MTSDSLSNKALRERFLRELDNSRRVLDDVETAAVAEAWASSAVAEWLALGGSLGGLSQHLIEHPKAAKVVAWIEGGERPVGDGWLGEVGSHAPVDAWVLADPRAPGEQAVIVTFESAEGDRHDVSVTIVDSQLLSVVVGPEGLADAAQEEHTNTGITVEPIAVRAAIEMVTAATSRLAPEFSVLSEASLPLLFRRIGVPAEIGRAHSEAAVEVPPRDTELEAYGADVLRSALRDELDTAAPAAVTAALESCAERFAAHDPDAITLATVAGVSPLTADATIDALCRLTAGYFAPATLAPHPPAEQEALVQLEVADWIGVILGIARAPVGTDVDGAMLVRSINRAPEITTTIPKKDAAGLGWTFEAMLYAWELTGVLIDGAVGPAARWLLPHAAIQLWEGETA